MERLVEMKSKEFGQGDLRQREPCTDTKERLGEGFLGLPRLFCPLLLKADALGCWDSAAALCTRQDSPWELEVDFACSIQSCLRLRDQRAFF